METIVDILEDIDIKYKEYVRAKDELDEKRVAYLRTEERLFSRPEIINHSGEVFEYYKQEKENKVQHEQNRLAVEEAIKVLRVAKGALLEAIPIKGTWFRLSDGYLKGDDYNVHFVSHKAMIEKLLGKED